MSFSCNKQLIFVIVVAALIALQCALAADVSTTQQPPSSSSHAASKPPTVHSIQQRQSPANMISTIGSLLPSLITNVAPLLLLVGLGALVAPALSVGAMGLLRESRRSFNEYASPFVQLANLAPRPLQTSPQDLYYFTKRSLSGTQQPHYLHDGLRLLASKVLQAIDEADKKYA